MEISTQLYASAALIHGKSPRQTLNRRQSVQQRRLGHLRENLLPGPGISWFRRGYTEQILEINMAEVGALGTRLGNVYPAKDTSADHRVNKYSQNKLWAPKSNWKKFLIFCNKNKKSTELGNVTVLTDVKNLLHYKQH
jgi:hypothetical protein